MSLLKHVLSNELEKGRSPPPSPNPSVALTLTPASDDDLGGGRGSGGSTGSSSPGNRRRDLLTPNRFLTKSRTDPTLPTSCRSSFRDRFSEAGSFLSLYLINSPSKLLKNSMMLAALSAFLLALYGMLYGIIKNDIARTTVTVTRGLLQFFCNLFLSFMTGEQLKVYKKEEIEQDPSSSLCRVWFHFALVIIFGGLRLCMLFAALQLTEMSIVHTILNGSPVMVMVLAHFMLSGGERLTWIKMAAAVLLIAGILLNTNPYEAIMDAIVKENFESGVGIVVAIMALTFSAFGSIYTKMISKHFTKLHISSAIGASIAVFGLLSVLFDDYFDTMKVMKDNHMFLEEQFNDTSSSSHNLTLEQVMPLLDDLPLTDLRCLFGNGSDLLDATELANLTAMTDHMMACEVTSPPYFPTDINVWTTTIVVGLMGLGQQYCLIAAIKMGSPSRVSMMRSSSILFSFMLQSSNSVVPDWNQWLGAAVILGAIFINTLESQVRKKLQEWRRNLCPPPASGTSANQQWCLCCCKTSSKDDKPDLELKAESVTEDKLKRAMTDSSLSHSIEVTASSEVKNSRA